MGQHNRAVVLGLVLLGCLAFSGVASSQTRRPVGTSQSSQTAVSQADIQRLEESVFDVERSVDRLRDEDPALASSLRRRLDDLHDDVTYLKVKLRKERTVSRSELAEVRDQLQQIRSRATPEVSDQDRPRGTAGAIDRRDTGRQTADQPVRQGQNARTNEVPGGTEMDVRLQTSLSSGSSQVEDQFEATTLVDLMSGDRVLVPAGSTVRGVVSSVDKAGRLQRKGRLTLAFDRLSIQNRNYPIHATLTEALESGGYRDDAAKIGAGAGVGAIIGGILGGVKGALAGVLIGGGGVVAATEGQDVELPAGTVLRIRFDEPVTVR